MQANTRWGRLRVPLLHWGAAAAASMLLIVGMVAAVGPVTAHAATGSSACSGAPNPASTGGTISETVQSLIPIRTLLGTVVQLHSRTYYVNVPAGLTGPAPLMVANHGANQSATGFEPFSGWDQYAANNHFIVAYSQSLVNDPVMLGTIVDAPGDVWFFDQNGFDTQYLKKVVADIEARWCINTTRVYNSGFSEGGIMAQRMACDAPNIFAAFASYEGSESTLPDVLSVLNICNPSRPAAVGLFQGGSDPLSNSLVGQEDIDSWTTRNNCPGKPAGLGWPLFNATPSSTTTDTYGTSKFYAGCASAITEIWRVLPGIPHSWPVGAGAEDLRNKQWNYLTGYTLP